MILNDPCSRFQRHAILWRWICHEWYDIQTYFQWNTNRDLHTPYSTVSFRMTLTDIEWLSKIFQLAMTHSERWRRQWCTADAMMAWSSLAHSVLLWCMVPRDQSCMFCTTFITVCPPQSTGFKSGEFGGHGRGRMDSGVSLSSNFMVALARCLIRKVKYWHWLGEADFCYVSSFALPSWYSMQKNYTYIFAFVKFMPEVPSVPFFPDMVYMRTDV